MADFELDSWICSQLGLTYRELTADDLFNMVQYFFPEARFSDDPEEIKKTKCAYIRLAKDNDAKNDILIDNPSIARVTQALYILVIAITIAVKMNQKEITVMRYL